MRFIGGLVLGLVLAIVCVAAPASADPNGGAEQAPSPTTAHAGPGTLYLNRCVGGCTIHKSGINDARTHASTIPNGTGPDFQMTEFAWGDTEWNAIVQCMKEVYSPFALKVTDVLPVPGEAYNEAIIAGSNVEIGHPEAGGIANGGCDIVNYSINFTFANDYSPYQRVFQLCAVAAQESGHSYGLDHTYSFLDGSSGCRDPMTYRGDCGGQKFFRNETANCGENAVRACHCGANQNSHLKLLTGLGAGTPITSPPTVSVQTPAEGATVANGAFVNATAFAQRGVKTIELWLNGYLWGTAPGAKFGPEGQPESRYAIALPPTVPDGIIDIVVKAKDDIDVTTSAPMVTVTKGAPCASAETCANGQRCDAGRCLWDPPVGQIGDDCTFTQFCTSGLCSGTADKTICTQECIAGVADSCPAAYDCLETSPGRGVCWPQGAADPGCCSASNEAAAQSLFVAFGLAFVIRRRRR
jgi:hypothetical protein